MNKNQNLIFLLGSGVSSLPKVDYITKKILKPYCDKNELNKLLFDSSSNLSNLFDKNVKLKKVLTFLKHIKYFIDRYYTFRRGKEHSANYEEIYFIIDEMDNNRSGDYYNPALKPFEDYIINELKLDKNIRGLLALENIISLSKRYMIRGVRNILKQEIDDDLGYLNFISDSTKDFRTINIFTLNHDLVLEKYFDSFRISYIDGFGTDNGNTKRYWKPTSFELSDTSIKLHKIHGSINWDIDTSKDPRPFINIDVEEPKLLIGVDNKILEYSGGIYLDLTNQFYQSLHKSRILIIIGYGFADLGINRQIINWCSNELNNKKIVVVDKNIESLKNRINIGWLRNKWNDLMKKNILKEIQMDAKDIKWVNLQNVLN